MSDLKSLSRKLIVEGRGDIDILDALFSKTIAGWIEKDKPVEIRLSEKEGGKDSIKYENIERIAKGEPSHLGIVLDADNSFKATQDKIENIFKKIEAYIKENDNKTKLSYWIMPTHRSEGMIEDFMLNMIQDNELKEYAKSVAVLAKTDFNAPYKDAHVSKAYFKTWLAWQDQPGISAPTAINKNIFDINASLTSEFLKWFRDFYELNPKI